MLPGDSEEAAREMSSMFTDPRVEQFWDAKRLSGIAYSTAVFPRWLKYAAESIPPGHMLYQVLRKRAEAPPQRHPLWDIAVFYGTGVEWTDHPPAPRRWVKQIAYFGHREDGTSGLFWRNDFAQEPFASDWLAELTDAMKHVIDEDPTGT